MAGNAGGVGGCCRCGGLALRAGLVGFVGIGLRVAADPFGASEGVPAAPDQDRARARALCVQNHQGRTMRWGALPSGDEDVPGLHRPQ